MYQISLAGGFRGRAGVLPGSDGVSTAAAALSVTISASSFSVGSSMFSCPNYTQHDRTQRLVTVHPEAYRPAVEP